MDKGITDCLLGLTNDQMRSYYDLLKKKNNKKQIFLLLLLLFFNKTKENEKCILKLIKYIYI